MIGHIRKQRHPALQSTWVWRLAGSDVGRWNRTDSGNVSSRWPTQSHCSALPHRTNRELWHIKNPRNNLRTSIYTRYTLAVLGTRYILVYTVATEYSVRVLSTYCMSTQLHQYCTRTVLVPHQWETFFLQSKLEDQATTKKFYFWGNIPYILYQDYSCTEDALTYDTFFDALPRYRRI